ncbi:MAG: hypothetical protein GSR73_01610 [Desulfurococcales archaeon]|nr:hypothetical protein [Desulfurococcales archaeon]
MPVEIPLDRICVKSGILCPRCQSLVDEGVYNDLDVRVMRALLGVERRFRSHRIKYVKSYQIDDILYVLVESSPGIPSSLGADLRRALGADEIKRVIVIEYNTDKRKLIETLISPYRVLGIQEAYLPDGSNMVVIKLPSEAKKLIESVKGKYIVKLAERLLGKQIYIEYAENAGSAPLKPEWLGLKKPNVRDLLDKLG